MRTSNLPKVLLRELISYYIKGMGEVKSISSNGENGVNKIKNTSTISEVIKR